MISPFRLIGVGLFAFAVSSVQSVPALNKNDNSDNRAVGSITPIIDNPIPSWATKDDFCIPKSCDDCPVTSSQYCKWTDDGKSHCCSPHEQTNAQSIFDSFASFVTGIFGNGELTIGKATIEPSEPEAESAKIVPVPKDQDVLPETAAVLPPSGQQTEPESASITPIMANPIPAWASLNDYCIGTDGCDSCPTSGYCSYDKTRTATCCVKADEKHLLTPSVSTEQSGTDTKVQKNVENVHGSISPITENPIPKEASSVDSCQKLRSCDMCKEKQYCKYTSSGVPQCCTLASEFGNKINKASVSPVNNVAEAESAKIVPVPKDQDVLPESASVMPASSQQTDPESASITPIKKQIPVWASSNDVCLEMPCDSCGTHQYCKFTEKGVQQCCGSVAATL